MSQKEKVKKLLSLNVEKIINKESLKSRLLSGKKLRIKHGIDPTSPNLHIGHAIVLWKLKEFQDLGHKIVLILGSFTAQIGDPSDKLNKRPFLSKQEVEENLKEYKNQIGKILDASKVEWHKNNEWFKDISLREFDNLAELFSVQQMMARRNFKKRWDNDKEISIRELHYPLYQGYDSVAVKADVEVAGNDQLFNILAGRKIQQAYNQEPQDILTVKMLTGTDNNKMSKSQGNVIYISDTPKNQYGKIMSLQDSLILPYFKLCTNYPKEKVKELEKKLKAGDNPRDIKAKLAYEIVKIYHGQEKANKAAKEFDRVFKEKKLPKNTFGFKIKEKEYKLADLIKKVGFTKSKSQARRLIEQGAVRINKKKINDRHFSFVPKGGEIIQVGKKRFIRLEFK
ncbi:MAG TPA: tyrosine--tRNA ligase [Patescibacteria group bacterium]|nr:tyrosine--tRNA ligase [Patescibacteria group bacterium]